MTSAASNEPFLIERLRAAKTRDDAAAVYADALRTCTPSAWYWRPLNALLLERWSTAGLKYVKKKAWKLAGQPR